MKRNKSNHLISKAKKTSIKDLHEQMEIKMIFSRLSLPMNKRTGFLRKRMPNGGSSL